MSLPVCHGYHHLPRSATGIQERKTGWSLAEHAGEKTPDGMRRLFTTARWDADLVRDDLRGYVAAALGDPDGVLTGDDTVP